MSKRLQQSKAVSKREIGAKGEGEMGDGRYPIREPCDVDILCNGQSCPICMSYMSRVAGRASD